MSSYFSFLFHVTRSASTAFTLSATPAEVKNALQSATCSLLMSAAVIFHPRNLFVIHHEYCPNPIPASRTVADGEIMAHVSFRAFLTCHDLSSRMLRSV